MKNGCEEESSDENEEDVRERISMLAGLQQRSFISEQEIMNIYLLQDKLIKERPKYMQQLKLQDKFFFF